MTKLKTCNKFITTSDCGFIILDEEFEDGFVYVYVFQLKPVDSTKNTYNQVLIRTNKYLEVKCNIKRDGHYIIQVCKVPDFIYTNDKFINGDIELSILDIVNYYKHVQYNHFSVCWLRQCFINLCKSIFDSKISIDCRKDRLDEDVVYKRDLVWAALNVIQYLVEMCQFREAERILERITGCNGLCDNFNSLKGGGCGCG